MADTQRETIEHQAETEEQVLKQQAEKEGQQVSVHNQACWIEVCIYSVQYAVSMLPILSHQLVVVQCPMHVAFVLHQAAFQVAGLCRTKAARLETYLQGVSKCLVVPLGVSWHASMCVVLHSLCVLRWLLCSHMVLYTLFTPFFLVLLITFVFFWPFSHCCSNL